MHVPLHVFDTDELDMTMSLTRTAVVPRIEEGEKPAVALLTLV